MSPPVVTEERHPFHWLPNALTTFRIFAVPGLVAGILLTAYIERVGWLVPWRATLALLILCMASDFFDGWFARRWNLVSGYGRMLDPIADKLLVAGCLIALCIVVRGTPLVLVPALVIVGRDIMVSGAREHAALSARVMSPTKLAKWKTTFEFLAIAVLIVWVAAQGWLPVGDAVPSLRSGLWAVGLALLWLAAALSAWTGAGYLRQALSD